MAGLIIDYLFSSDLPVLQLDNFGILLVGDLWNWPSRIDALLNLNSSSSNNVRILGSDAYIVKRVHCYISEQDSLPARAKLTMRVAYTIATTTCESALINFNGRIFEQFNKQLNDRMNGELCNKVNCSDLNVDIECGQAQDDTISLVEVTIPDCVQK